MPNVLEAKNQARTNVINIVEQAQKNIQDAIEKLLPNYINKVIIINKTIKNLLQFQIKNKNSCKGFNLVEIQNYETLINDNNNIALDKIKIAMSIFLIEIENAKKQSTYNVNKAREQTMNDIQYKWDQYINSKKLKI
jgi:vacuolar-type H+-ATPase subunit H